METTQAREVNRILLEALGLDVRERPSFLDQACRDQAVRRQVDELLSYEDVLLEDFERPIVDLCREAPFPRGLGPYRIVRQLGEGGMGTVYLAVNDDDPGEGEVAIKVLRPGLHVDVARRFRTERHILSQLDHPGIARLHGDGTTQDGRPYFVMECVAGERIDRYSDSRRLMVRERLELFRDVCDAVGFAHRNLVLHRDVKPSNILVTADGVPKLLDFGIAKLLDSRTHEPLTRTATGLRLMTLEYASPEHVAGLNLTTASDVYSLGVLLYELLSGHRPFRLEDRNVDELRRVLRGSEPEKPSQAVTRKTRSPTEVSAARGTDPRTLRRTLSGDLDEVVLTTLRRRPKDRYASADDLKRDVERYLAGRTPRATLRAPVYRARRALLRRRRELVALVAGMGLTGLAILAYASKDVRLPGTSDAPEVTGPPRPVNPGFESGSTYQFGRLEGWGPNGAWAYHAGFSVGGQDGLGQRFGFYSAGTGEMVGQVLDQRFEPHVTYRFKSWALGGGNHSGRLPYQIGYARVDGDVQSLVPLVTRVVDLDGRDAWLETEGVSYTTGADGVEIGRQIVLCFGGGPAGGASDVWLDNVVFTAGP